MQANTVIGCGGGSCVLSAKEEGDEKKRRKILQRTHKIETGREKVI